MNPKAILWAVCLPDGKLAIAYQSQALIFDNERSAAKVMNAVGDQWNQPLHIEAVEVINVPSV